MSDVVDDCAICLQSLTDDVYIPLLTSTKSCGHKFHLACLVKAAKECLSRFSDPGNCPWCPLCKQRMMWFYPVKEGEGTIVEVEYTPPRSGMKPRKHQMRFEEKRVVTKGVDKNFRPIEPVPERTKWYDAYRVTGTPTEGSEGERSVFRAWFIAPLLLIFAATIYPYFYHCSRA